MSRLLYNCFEKECHANNKLHQQPLCEEFFVASKGDEKWWWQNDIVFWGNKYSHIIKQRQE